MFMSLEHIDKLLCMGLIVSNVIISWIVTINCQLCSGSVISVFSLPSLGNNIVILVMCLPMILVLIVACLY